MPYVYHRRIPPHNIMYEHKEFIKQCYLYVSAPVLVVRPIRIRHKNANPHRDLTIINNNNTNTLRYNVIILFTGTNSNGVLSPSTYRHYTRPFQGPPQKEHRKSQWKVLNRKVAKSSRQSSSARRVHTCTQLCYLHVLHCRIAYGSKVLRDVWSRLTFRVVHFLRVAQAHRNGFNIGCTRVHVPFERRWRW